MILAALAIAVIALGLVVMAAAAVALTERRPPRFEPIQGERRVGYFTNFGRHLTAKESARVAETTGRTTHGE
jgi:hypothetical protein